MILCKKLYLQATILDTNNKQTVIWVQIFLSDTIDLLGFIVSSIFIKH